MTTYRFIVIGIFSLLVCIWKAQACSCHWEYPGFDHHAIAVEETERAEFIFQGSILELQKFEMQSCMVDEPTEAAYEPKGLVKVTRGVKGVETDDIVVVNFSNAYSRSFLNENCEVEVFLGNSCLGPFDPSSIETDERWWVGQTNDNNEVLLFDNACGPSFYRVADLLFPIERAGVSKE